MKNKDSIMRNIERYQKLVTLNYLLYEICLGYIDVNKFNFFEKYQFTRYKDYIMSTRNNLSSRSNAISKFSEFLNNIRNITIPTNRWDVERLIEEKKPNRIELDYSEKMDHADRIASDPKKALIHYLEEMIKYEKWIEKEKIELSKPEKKEKEEKKDYDGSSYTRSDLAPSYSSRSTAQYNATNDEEEIEEKPVTNEKVTADIEAAIDKGTVTNLKESEIRQVYPFLDSSSDYDSMHIFKAGLKAEEIDKKKELTLYDMMVMAMKTHAIMVKELTQGAKLPGKIEELYDKYNIKNSFEKYRRTYDRFMKYYLSVSEEKRKRIDNVSVMPHNYEETFGKGIVTPERLLSKINTDVREIIFEKRHDSFTVFNNDYFYARMLHATRYMNLEDVKLIYNDIRGDWERELIYARDEEERKYLETAREHNLETIQTAFARVLMQKTELISGRSIWVSNEDEVKKQSIKMAAIIKYLFKEKIKNKGIEIAAEGQDLGTIYRELDTTYRAKFQASYNRRRIEDVYGLERVKKAFSTLMGMDARIAYLMRKEILSPVEQEELIEKSKR